METHPHFVAGQLFSLRMAVPRSLGLCKLSSLRAGKHICFLRRSLACAISILHVHTHIRVCVFERACAHTRMEMCLFKSPTPLLAVGSGEPQEEEGPGFPPHQIWGMPQILEQMGPLEWVARSCPHVSRASEAAEKRMTWRTRLLRKQDLQAAQGPPLTGLSHAPPGTGASGQHRLRAHCERQLCQGERAMPALS